MKNIENLKLKLDLSRNGFQKLKWTELYETEDELISDLKKVTYMQIERNCKGYEYLISFKKQLEKNGTLSDTQIVQLKRLAPELVRGLI